MDEMREGYVSMCARADKRNGLNKTKYFRGGREFGPPETTACTARKERIN